MINLIGSIIDINIEKVFDININRYTFREADEIKYRFFIIPHVPVAILFNENIKARGINKNCTKALKKLFKINYRMNDYNLIKHKYRLLIHNFITSNLLEEHKPKMMIFFENISILKGFITTIDNEYLKDNKISNQKLKNIKLYPVEEQSNNGIKILFKPINQDEDEKLNSVNKKVYENLISNYYNLMCSYLKEPLEQIHESINELRKFLYIADKNRENFYKNFNKYILNYYNSLKERLNDLTHLNEEDIYTLEEDEPEYSLEQINIEYGSVKIFIKEEKQKDIIVTIDKYLRDLNRIFKILTMEQENLHIDINRLKDIIDLRKLKNIAKSLCKFLNDNELDPTYRIDRQQLEILL